MYVLLIFFFAAAVTHLAAQLLKRRILIGVTKPLLLLTLALYVLLRGQPDVLLVCALLCCWAGDVLLMFKGNVWFSAGGIFFFAGHVLLCLIFARQIDFADLPLAAVIPAAILYAGAAVAVMLRARRSAPKIMRIPMLLYLLANAAMNVFALTRLIRSPGVWTACSFAGAVLFFVSDCALFLLRCDPGRARFFKNDFFVMLTYISGVLLITLGLAPL